MTKGKQKQPPILWMTRGGHGAYIRFWKSKPWREEGHWTAGARNSIVASACPSQFRRVTRFTFKSTQAVKVRIRVERVK